MKFLFRQLLPSAFSNNGKLAQELLRRGCSGKKKNHKFQTL
jgi:hypothetical protein